MALENGSISINTENIFPIIKKWLYSEKDIFIRELVSNASDAISKLKKLASIGEAEIGEDNRYLIRVVVNKDENTIKIIDNGIGMTEDEVKKYINQIAFSGAKDFIEKYKDKTDEGQIIGHFGLGFYSAFMVAETVQIDTLSFQKGAKAVKWVSSEGTEYEMDESELDTRGTVITLHMAEDSLEFLDEYKMREILVKYFSFLPYELYLEDSAKKEEPVKDDADKENAEGEEKKEKEAPKPLNDISPLWLKAPKDCTDEEYKSFYTKVFHDFNEPLFWIHLNMDYPFNLKGILYFPKLKHEFETNEGQIKLYYNQVFVADNIKEVIPEFLMLLKGTIDCPDLPLNVSRSFLQNDGYVSKISSHITKKVADKLSALYENERENYNKYWDDINPFVKYGCLKEEKFFDRVKDIVIYKTTNDDYATLKDYLERNKEKHENKVFYITDEKQQAQYIKLFKDNEMEAIKLTTMIDSHFISFLETKESGVKFSRIDSDLSDSLKDTEAVSVDAAQKEGLEKLFKEVMEDDKLKVQVESLKASAVPGMILLSEQSRRMQEMSKMFGGADMSYMFPKEETLVLNSNNGLVQFILEAKDDEARKDDVKMICQQVHDLAMMGHKQLEPEAMTRFIERSSQIMLKLAGK
ncbi:molecular chaperone HtpG [Anaerobacterium chartisolvens]|uniref:Molecular chaperone HtpG n=1 Tax=Anaerobacterium chartisolvens TaxID=1297424 RepID=A0A369B6J6_9FIRM|nr:molecular chaperone HtpG [Anaerobacterium chartisolvens]RCX17140.1 molecular chaperone HtpG [Anaerobacterium chartisolvens]